MPDLTRRSAWHEPIMGTSVEIQVILDGVDRESEADAIIDSIIVEMLRLQSIFSSVDHDSEFSRWLRDDGEIPSAELSEVLALAKEWHRSSNGRFNPRAASLTSRWIEAERSGIPPSRHELETLASTTAELPWFREDLTGSWRPGPRCDSTLNAIAKGWIVDAATEFAFAHHPIRSLMINAGGDVRRHGPDPLVIGIENPFRPYDNEPPIAAVTIVDRAIATSGTARKGFVVDGIRFGHIIDPRTGWPVENIVSITVVAPTAAEADVLATVLGVEPPQRALEEAERMDLAVLIVTSDQLQLRSEAWRAMELDLNEA